MKAGRAVFVRQVLTVNMEFQTITKRLRAHSRFARKTYKAKGSCGRDYQILRAHKGWEIEVWTNNWFTEGYVFSTLAAAKQGVIDIENGCFDKSTALQEILIN